MLLNSERETRKKLEDRNVLGLIATMQFSLDDQHDYKACQKAAADLGWSTGRFRKALDRIVKEKKEKERLEKLVEQKKWKEK